MSRLFALSFVALVAIASIAIPAPAGAAADDIYPMYFPVVGPNSYTDTFGALRGGGRTHEGTDIMADKMTPVVAVADGVIGGQAEDGTWYEGWFHGEGDCCAFEMLHDDGWRSTYIHLNNDTPGTDDGLGWGFAEGIGPGVRVEAGQIVGWVGDSGNAEACDCPHVHFELHAPGDVLVNPYPSLQAATVLQTPYDPNDPSQTPPPDPAPSANSGTFVDDDSSVHEANIELLFELGLTQGCNPPTNDRYCPADTLTRGQAATFLQRHFAFPDADQDYFTDDNASVHEGSINALRAAGVAFGCSETQYCPAATITRSELAAFFVSAFALPPAASGPFADVSGDPYEAEINALAAAGLTLGCNEAGDLYCPNAGLKRGQYASFMIRSLEWDGTISP